MNWEFDDLWNKSKLYAARAFEQPRDEYTFPFLATLALEFLGRATLAKVHPALLADPQSGDNILYACGYGAVKSPRSVPAKTVFIRCQSIVTGFTKSEFGLVMSLMQRRNEELHGGGLPYEDFRTELWLADYYRVCKLLLTFLELNLEDFIGPDETEAAEEMIEAAEEEQKSEILKLVAAHKTVFEDLDKEDVEERRERIRQDLRRMQGPVSTDPCPSCESTCVRTGEVIRTSDPRLEDDQIKIETIVLPTKLDCGVCGLSLKGHGSLHIAGMGGQFTVEDLVDPEEYYQEEFDPYDYYELEYMNE